MGGGARRLPRLNVACPCIFVGIHVSVACKNSVESQREWSGSAQIPVQVQGRSLNNPPPLQALSLPLKRVMSPSDICPKQFWDFSRKFPEMFRNISNIFRYFVRTLFTGVRNPPKVFFPLFFRTFPLLSESFSEHFEHFPLHFGHFP